MRTLLEDIMYDRRHDVATLPLRAVLRVLAGMYGALASFRSFLYSRDVIPSGSLPCKVVSIGNITVGGTGKTPVVIMTARMLVNAGYRTVVVSRGYRRKNSWPLIVSDGENVLVSPAESGDEPHLIASSLPGVPVVVGSSRYEAARLARKRFHPDVILLDDAFQHFALRRDTDIVTLDAVLPFGSGSLLPRGTLRESPRVLSRARAAIITRFDSDSPNTELESDIRRFNPEIAVFYSRHLPVALRRLSDGVILPPEDIAGRKVAALSNIANPASFHDMLGSLGANIVWKCIRPDHYHYHSEELTEIGREARRLHDADALVITAKDERNLPEDADFGNLDVFVLEIEATLIDKEAEYLALVLPDGKGGNT